MTTYYTYRQNFKRTMWAGIVAATAIGIIIMMTEVGAQDPPATDAAANSTDGNGTAAAGGNGTAAAGGNGTAAVAPVVEAKNATASNASEKLCLNVAYERKFPSPGDCVENNNCIKFGPQYYCESIGSSKFCCPKISGECVDESNNCAERAQYCMDPLHSQEMARRCRKTCNRCRKCQDLGTDCPSHKSYCFYPIYHGVMAWQCPLTCNLCYRSSPFMNKKLQKPYLPF